jgi:insulysin
MKKYKNFKFQQPCQQAMYYCFLILQDQDHTWPWMEKLEVLLHLEAEDLAKFAPVMLSRAFLECYIAGSFKSLLFILIFGEYQPFLSGFKFHFVTTIFPGNIETSEAESMIQHIEDVLFSGPNPICQPLFSLQHAANRVVKLERGMSYFYPAEGLNPNDENSALVHYIQVILHDSKRWYGPVKCWNNLLN